MSSRRALATLRRWCIDDAALQPRMFTKFASEFLATAMFHLIGSVSGTAEGNGLVLTALVYGTATTSGGHLNPAVTLAFFLLGHVRLGEMLLYWTAQVTGAAVGALWVAWLVPQLAVRAAVDAADQPRYDGCFVPAPHMRAVQVFGWEAVGAFCFISIVHSVVAMSALKSGYGNIGPIIIGIALTATAMAVGPFTGASLNPARTLGSPIVFDCPDAGNAVWYVLGELCGAALVPLVIAPTYGIAANAWYMPLLAHVFDLRLEVPGGEAVVAGEEACGGPPALELPASPADTEQPQQPAQDAGGEEPHAAQQPGEGSLRTSQRGERQSRIDRRGSLTLVASAPGAVATAEAGVREVRYVCLVPGAGTPGAGGGGGAARRAPHRASIELLLTPRAPPQHQHQHQHQQHAHAPRSRSRSGGSPSQQPPHQRASRAGGASGGGGSGGSGGEGASGSGASGTSGSGASGGSGAAPDVERPAL